MERGYMRLYFAADWSPADCGGDSRRSLYGLDMEASWLMMESARLLGCPEERAGAPRVPGAGGPRAV